MLGKTVDSEFSFSLPESEEEIQGVQKTIILPKLCALESGDALQRNLGYLVFTLSELFPPKRVLIRTLKGRILVHITENFFLGAVLNEEANAEAIDAMLRAIASNLEEYFMRLKPVSMKAIEEKIKKISDGVPG
jgi:hypothetical protein